LCILLLQSLEIKAQEELVDSTYQYEYEEDEVYSTEIPKINLVDIGFLINVPKKGFNRYHSAPIFGFYGSYHRQFRSESPLFLGFNIGYNSIDNYKAEVERLFDNFSEIWDGSTTSSVMDFNMSARYFVEARFWRIEPYVEPAIGFNWFFTNTTFTFPDSEESDFDNNQSDVVITYGGAIGFMIYITNNYYANLSLGYYPGLSAEYYVEKDIQESLYNTTLQGFELKKSTSDMLRIKAGFNIAF
jgi:hypothetical protein